MTELALLPVEQMIADYLTSLLGPARPRRLARMSYPGETKRQKNKKTGKWETVERGKYEDIYGPLTSSMLVDHARGTDTYAVTLDQQGKARAGVIEIDQGGRAAIDSTLRAAQQLGLVAFAFELLSADGIHSGGHVWLPYDNWYSAADILAQVDQVIALAGLPANTERWPRANKRGSDQGIRAPFGKHQTKETRGALRLQTGEITLLDTELVDGVFTVVNLQQNPAPPTSAKRLAEVQSSHKGDYAKSKQPVIKQSPSHKVIRLTSGRLDTSAIFAEARAKFNADRDWADLLSEYGGTEVSTGYWACDCGVAHTHSVQLAVTSQDKIISLSNRCGWARDDKALDKFGFWCDQAHGGNYRAAAEAAARQYGLWVEPPAPARPDTQYRAPSQDAERKRASRLAARQERIARIDPLIDQLDQDTAIYPFARDLFAYHASAWSSGPEHYASIERITREVLSIDRAPTENEYRRVQLAHQRLIECHYLKRTVRGSSATKETNCWQPGTMDGYRVIPTCESTEAHQEAKNEGRITLIESSKDLLLESVDLVSRAPSPHHENVYAASIEDWAWQADDGHSPDELTMLDLSPEECNVFATFSTNVESATAQQEAPQAPFVFDRSDLDRYSVDCGRYDATGRVVWRLWDDTADQVLGEYDTEAEAYAAAGAPVEGVHVGEVVDSDQWLVTDNRNMAIVSEYTSPAPAFAEADSLNVWAAALDHTPPAPAETILDMDEIDRWVSEIQAVADVRRDERHDPQLVWEKHEAQVWREAHPVAPQPQAVYAKNDATREAERARIRAAWDAIGDDPRALGAKLGKLRGRLKNFPQSRRALEWQIHELHDRLAALTPVSEAVDGARSQAPARRPAPSAMAQEVFYANA